MNGVALYRVNGPRFVTTHAEAFCLMKYQNRATRRTEWLWNSRDGVTPFVIDDPQADAAAVARWRERRAAKIEAGSSEYATWLHQDPDPGVMQHVDMQEDVFIPNFVPPVGMRVFLSWGAAPDHVKAALRERWVARVGEMEVNPPPGAEMDALTKSRLLEGEPFGMEAHSPLNWEVDQVLHDAFAKMATDHPVRPARIQTRSHQ